ncbi:hypothetical protein [Cohnella soli]|uniref:Uncharacterized protein n=1 Tax=Cohnella soli TaxID=425005 RepID=A0ABW0HP05_9BACL
MRDRTQKREGISCATCNDIFIIEGTNLVPRSAREATLAAEAKVQQLCQAIKQYALNNYEPQMVDFVSKIPASKWYDLWQVGTPAIGTFRKDLKMTGVKGTFTGLLYGNYPHNVERIILTLQSCGIEDPQLMTRYDVLQSLIQDHRIAQDEERAQRHSGNKINEYTSYADPEDL